MNREHEFRGFDGKEWRYGDLEYNRKDDVARIHTYNDDGSYNKQYLVDPDTVGQFVGMKDKHGNKVFEGDIVEVYDFTSAYASKHRGVVKMYRGSWCVEYKSSIFDTVFRPMLIFDDFADRKTEIIGNIYDNLYLLNEK